MTIMFTTETRGFKLADVLPVCEALGLPVVVEEYSTYRYTRVQVGTVLVPAYDEPQWRDLGEGPSWQEKYTLTEELTVPLLWEPVSQYPYCEWRVQYPVTSLLRQGGAKWGGVSVAARDDTEPKASVHTHHTYGYDGNMRLGTTGTMFGFAATLEDCVSFREIPYAHDPSATHWVMDLVRTH